ncbi:MAG: universal stress protein [Thermodesulfovibrionales bacterium]|jgi:nucleotide-binding universal stress UspA family protein
MEIKRILFATDFSERTATAISYAADMAKRYGAKLYIVHVVQDVEKITKWYAPKVNMEELHKAMKSKALSELQQCGSRELSGYKDVEYQLLMGTPDEEILKFKIQNHIDLIILGTDGGTASKVMRKSRRPVLIVSPQEEIPESTSAKLCSGGTEIRL